MKKLTVSLIFVLTGLISIAQCNEVILVINSKTTDDNLTKEDLSRAQALLFSTPACNEVLRVTRFTVALNGKEASAKSRMFTKEMKVMFHKAKVGDTLLIKDIRGYDKPGLEVMRLIANHTWVIGDESSLRY